MAIIIPSKKIFSVVNPKVRNNDIDEVRIETTNINSNVVITGENVYNKQILNLSNKHNYTVVDKGFGYGLGAPKKFAFAKYDQKKVLASKVDNGTEIRLEQIKIPKLKDKSYISNIYLDNSNIKVELIGTIEKGTVSGTIEELVYSEPTEISNPQVFTIPTEITAKFGLPYTEATVKLTPLNDNGENLLFSDGGDDGENLFLNIGMVCGVRITRCGAYVLDYMDDYINKASVEGEYEKYVPTEINLSVMGETIGIELSTGNVTYKSENSNGETPISLDGNELMQNSARINGKLLTADLADNIFAQYKGGKEAINLSCSIGEYYSIVNDLEISTKGYAKFNGQWELKAEYLYADSNFIGTTQWIVLKEKHPYDVFFECTYYKEGSPQGKDTLVVPSNSLESNKITLMEADGIWFKIDKTLKNPPMSLQASYKIIPMKRNEFGEDIPISNYSNGSPKVFEVINESVAYDGTILQNLEAQEISFEEAKKELQVPIVEKNNIKYVLSQNGEFYNASELLYEIAEQSIETALWLPVKEISENIFYDNETVTSVEIPKNITIIGANAFAYTHNLKKVYFNATNMPDLPENNGAFAWVGVGDGWGDTLTGNCEIVIGKNVTSIPARLLHPLQNYDYRTYGITAITFEQDSVCKSVGTWAFGGLHELKKLNFPNSVTTIGERACQINTELAEVTLPNKLTEIPIAMFNGCLNLKKIGVTGKDNLIGNTLPNTLKTIQHNAFRKCNSLEHIYIPKSVKSIGAYAFYECDNLKNIYVGASYGEISGAPWGAPNATIYYDVIA